MTLRDLIAVFRKNALLVAGATVLVVTVVGVTSALSAPVYRSSASLYFSLDFGGSPSDLNQGSTYTQNQMLSFAHLAALPVVLDPVIDTLGLDMTAQELAGSVSASRPQETSILDIAATSGDAEESAAIANEVARELAVAVEGLAPRAEDGQSTVTVRVVKEAQTPQYPVAPNIKRNIAAAFVAGLLGGMVLAYLRDVLDTRVRRPEDVSDLTGIPVLAQISRMTEGTPAGRAAAIGSSSYQAEDFRRLRTNLQFLSVDDSEGLCLVFSSAMPAEGKTTVAINLAVALAETEMRVLLIDADMRRPRVADYLGMESSAGLTTVLIGRATFEEVIQPWGGSKLDVLAVGEIPPNPGELATTRALRVLLDEVRSAYDVVLIDAPPLLPVADAAILSRITSGVVLVADSRRLRRAQLREAVDGVHAAGGSVLGVVLNKVRPRRVSQYQYESHPVAPARLLSSRPDGEVWDVVADPGPDPNGAPIRLGDEPPPALADSGPDPDEALSLPDDDVPPELSDPGPVPDEFLGDPEVPPSSRRRR